MGQHASWAFQDIYEAFQHSAALPNWIVFMVLQRSRWARGGEQRVCGDNGAAANRR